MKDRSTLWWRFRWPGQRRLYLDLGANHGVTIARFLDAHPGWTVIGFEPTPTLAQELRGKSWPPGSEVTIVEAATWIADGTVDFFLGIGNDESSTVVPGKLPIPACCVDYTRPHRVAAIDFDRWLRENTRQNDKVVVKMDIEGAEYAVLDRCLSSGSIARIGKLIIEWHWEKYPIISETEHRRIRDAVAAIVPVEVWI